MNAPAAKPGVIFLQDMPAPKGWLDHAWAQFVEDAIAFRRDHGQAAHLAGWSALELFGMSRARPDRPNGWGAVPFIQGWRVTEVTMDAIAIEHPRSGKKLRIYRRKPWYDAVPVWTLANHN